MVFIYFLAKSAMLFNGAERFVQFSCEIVSKNLYNNLAKEVVESFFSIIALVAMFFFFFFFFFVVVVFFFNGAERFEQFWWKVTQETFCDIVSKSVYWFSGRSRCNLFFFFL